MLEGARGLKANDVCMLLWVLAVWGQLGERYVVRILGSFMEPLRAQEVREWGELGELGEGTLGSGVKALPLVCGSTATGTLNEANATEHLPTTKSTLGGCILRHTMTYYNILPATHCQLLRAP